MPVRQVETGAPVLTVAANGLGTPIVLSDSGVPFVVEGAGPVIMLSALSVLEDVEIGTPIGTLSVNGGAGSYTFAIASDPDSKFDVDDDQLATAALLDRETKAFHLVTIEADNGVDDPIQRTFTITVTNVLEVTLSALTFSATELTQGEAVTVGITGASSGSTLTVHAGALPAGMTLNSAAREITGTPSALASGTATIRETHPDGSNSPRDTVWSWEVVEEPVEPVEPGVPDAFGADDWSLGEVDEGAPELPAPWFELVTAQDEYPPEFDMEIGTTILTTDDIRLQGSTNEAFTALVVNEAIPVGTGPLAFEELAGVTSGEHFFRCRIERGASYGPWSLARKHGDTTAPVLSGDDEISEVEGVENPTGTVTCSETATFEVTGPDASFVSITPGPAGSATWTINETTDYYFGKRNYRFSIIATDLASLESDPFEILYAVAPDIEAAPVGQWVTVTGADKSTHLIIAGDPPLSATNNGGTGLPAYVRNLRAALTSKFQVEYTVEALGTDGFITIGVDNGTTSFATYNFGGTANSVQMQTTTGGQTFYVNGASVHSSSVNIAVGDVIGFRCDNDTGAIEFYRVRSGAVTTIHSRSFTPYAEAFAINGLKAWGPAASATANFGASAFARALTDGYEAY